MLPLWRLPSLSFTRMRMSSLYSTLPARVCLCAEFMGRDIGRRRGINGILACTTVS